MPDVDAWLGDTQPLPEWRGQEDRSRDTARIISDKPSSIVVVRNGVEQDAQTVRVDPIRDTHVERFSDTGSAGAMNAVQITGYKDHPTITDTDLRRGDQFTLDGMSFRVTMFLPNTDNRLIAFAEVVR